MNTVDVRLTRRPRTIGTSTRRSTSTSKIAIAKDRKNNESLPVTESERTQLRGLIGALQWPVTQSSPHLQAQVSMLAGDVTRAIIKTLQNANKALRMAKTNADVGLEYRYLGEKNDLTMIAYSDASFACRHDLSSQGGYLLVIVNNKVAEGEEGWYNVLDWRSWKLARVARSTLSAESQGASEAADALLFTSTFWNLVWSPWLPLDDVATAKLSGFPKLVVDAKGLYDLLIKEEVQAGTGSDKRTTIEVLVTQDKLKCCGARTSWVSSDLQYADGLTKEAAAQLLANRLRSHRTKLKSDLTFQAAKRKTAGERKKNAEMFAVKKPARAMQAMFAGLLNVVSVVNAAEINIKNTNLETEMPNTMENDIKTNPDFVMPNVTEYDITNFDFAIPMNYLKHLAEPYIMDFVYNPAVFLTTIMLMIFGCWLLRRWICRRDPPEPQAEPVPGETVTKTVMIPEDTETLRKMYEEVMVLREHRRGLEAELMKKQNMLIDAK